MNKSMNNDQNYSQKLFEPLTPLIPNASNVSHASYTSNKSYLPRTWAEVHLDRIEHNIREIRKRLPVSCSFMAAVKANAYGHGDVQVARAARNAGADALAVGTIHEALHLRKNDIMLPILVLSATPPEEADAAAKHHISLTVFQASCLDKMLKYKSSPEPLRIHIKMDTGMGRIGIREKAELEAMIPLLQNDAIIVEGIYTHFATANQADSAYYEEQRNRFNEMQQWMSDAGFSNLIVHCANSAAALQYPQNTMDMARVGAAIYGIHTCDEDVKRTMPNFLQPTLSLHTEIIHVKQMKPGSAISYDSTYWTTGDEWIATVPLGYADGCFRGFQGSYLLVDGHEAPITGKICMDQLMIRLPRYYPLGTKVTWIGRQRDKEITLDDLASHIGSIPQQILSLITDRVPRVYTYNDESERTLN
ncbi:alanine racemase [Paenibacillus eucommiae]|uniref:Alanine racemase n=1 Tax=Paenibacillus eucommiae TaxID=1355755 RepID=A0ABS4IN61_9BACL|nr:alanine racemase [Paenibacillus eucommiae]MBP1989003.1 alanine racemase [Paenibacillus eucommiae]